MNRSKELSEKIAYQAGLIKEAQVETYTLEDMQQALKAASICLKVAAEKQKELLELNEKLASTNSELVSGIKNTEKRALVESIVNKMFSKGLVTKKDFNSKIEDLMRLDTDAIEIFEETINALPEKQANEYVSDLTFLYNNNNIKDEKKNNMSDVISNIVGG